MKKIQVLGHTTVTIAKEIIVDDDFDEKDEEKVFNIAYETFGGIMAFAGNGGVDKLIGVVEDDECISADSEVEFDDYFVIGKER